MSGKKKGLKGAVEAAINSIGSGYDICNDLSLKYYTASSRLIAIDDEDQVRSVKLPGDISIPNVPKSINYYYGYGDGGNRHRLFSDVLSFDQMSEQFNQELSLSGKIPTGHFNAAFDMSGVWQRDATNTKTLAFDGYSITACDISISKSELVFRDHVKQAMPLSWDPAALARFIEEYGTHIIVGVKIGGTDIIYAKQLFSSPIQTADVQKKLTKMSDRFFKESDALIKFMKDNGLFFMEFPHSPYCKFQVQDIWFMCKRKGGSGIGSLSHNEWCQSVLSQPDVISMSIIPITSLLSGINGSGYLIHAINLYLKYKPRIEELRQFLEFQLPRKWAPVFGELAIGPERKPKNTASSKFSFVAPKLYVNTTPVGVGKKLVTGLRLYLEGKKSNCLAIHLQHLSSLPKTFRFEDEPNVNISRIEYEPNVSIPDASLERMYYKKVQLKVFSQVCTIPVESHDDSSVVTGANFELEDAGVEKVLFLRLHFSKVAGATRVYAPEWVGSHGLISTRFSALQKPLPPPPPMPSDININSAWRPPALIQTPKLSFVDTTEMTRGPEDLPGYWIVSGARLDVENGKISLKVKYSLLTVTRYRNEMG